MEHEILVKGAVLLATAAIVAPIAGRLKIGTVLGYLLAGVLIGPYGLRLFTEVENILHVAEFGVILLLFLIGLELRPQRLWFMRHAVFGVGGAQVAFTAAALLAVLMLTGKPFREAAFLGLALALSSTALVIQVLKEKGELGQSHGRLGFSVLLFQDLAAIPMIAFVGVFSIGGGSGEPMSLMAVIQGVAAIAAVIVGGRYILGPLYKLAAATGIKEAMTASALFTVVVVALLMELAGLSAALGAFIAGALLADSEYRHEIEADIQPFEGLLLGLFFVAIGMSLDLSLLLKYPLYIFSAVAVLIILKAVILWFIARWHGLARPARRRFALALAQGGEFAFVLMTAGHQAGAIFRPAADLVSVIVTLSMIATPLLLLADGWLSHRHRKGEDRHFDELPKERGHVIIAGFGRFGQIVARILAARRIHFTALDASTRQVDFVRNFGNKIYYGDPSRLDILKAAGADEARAFILAVDDYEASLKTAEMVRKHFPDLPILARARDRQHVHQLMHLGVKVIERETFLSALELSRRLLRTLGYDEAEARRTVSVFAEHDRRRLQADAAHFEDDGRVRESAKRQAQELEELFAADAEQRAEAERD